MAMSDKNCIYLFYTMRLRNTFTRLGLGSKIPLDGITRSDNDYAVWYSKAVLGNE